MIDLNDMREFFQPAKDDGARVLICEVCRQAIGRFNAADVHLPLKGEMFQSMDAAHGYPAPFPAGSTWMYMVCPWCEQRPFLGEIEGHVMTDKGRLELRPVQKPEQIKPEGHVCDRCGRSFASPQALGGHRSKCR